MSCISIYSRMTSSVTLPLLATKNPPRPNMTSPTRCPNGRKLTDQLPRCTPLHSLHQVARRYMRWTRYVQMHMILAHMSLDNLYFQLRTNLTNQIPAPNRYRIGQQRFPVFRNPHKVQFDVKFGMRCPTIVIHADYYNKCIA